MTLEYPKFDIFQNRINKRKYPDTHQSDINPNPHIKIKFNDNVAIKIQMSFVNQKFGTKRKCPDSHSGDINPSPITKYKLDYMPNVEEIITTKLKLKDVAKLFIKKHELINRYICHIHNNDYGICALYDCNGNLTKIPLQLMGSDCCYIN